MTETGVSRSASDTLKTATRGSSRYLYNPLVFDTGDFCLQSFDIANLSAENRIRQVLEGRGPVYVLDGRGGEEWILRHYYRGGFMACFNRDRFLNLGAAGYRSFRELRLLQAMQHAGLPVPQPVAARVQVDGYGRYAADLITTRIPDTETLEARLDRQSLPWDRWAVLGETIALVHNAGFEHVDLNVRNVLLNRQDGRFFLIDFDKARHRRPGRWCQRNIDRFKRSVEKLNTRRRQPVCKTTDWCCLIEAYEAARVRGL